MDYEFTYKLCMKYCFHVYNDKMFGRGVSMKFYIADKFGKVAVHL
jgi:hypothetical protein